MPEPTPESKTTASREPTTQVGGGETVPGNRPRGLQPSKRRRHIIPRHANADSECLPPAAVREARYLQNFFPFPLREEEKEASGG